MKLCFRNSWMVLALGFSISFSTAQEWTRFRGPNGTGISTAKGIPVQWAEKDLNWKVELPGIGHSSPVLWGDKIFLLSNDERSGQIFVLCLAAKDGRLLWKREFAFTAFQKHQFNSFASSSPAVDANHVYVSWSTPDRYTLAALD